MKIEVLAAGCKTGCESCSKTMRVIEKIVNNLGINTEIVKVEDIEKIVSYGVMVTPTVVINGDVKLVGKIPEENEVKKWIS
ncbi:MAG: thioredoxin family protein [Methanosarcina sp.]|jgi:small redox-active disulfide protein 2